MKLEIRKALMSDANEIYRLRRDRRLKGMQYRPFLEFPSTLIKLMSDSDEPIPENGYVCSTVLVNGIFAGHICQLYKTFSETSHISLGWNLVPELWGRGIMPLALTKFIDRKFNEKRKIVFTACCFESNSRCLRVIQKLGFSNEELALSEYFYHLCLHLGRNKVVKHSLNSDTWFNRKQCAR